MLKRAIAGLLVVALFISGGLGASTTAWAAPAPVSQTQHVQLGFSTSFPFSDSRSDSAIAGAVSYHFDFVGTATMAADMGADITFTYDRADLVPGGTVPVQITYTPTNDAGPEFTLDVVGDVTGDVDVDTAAEVAICLTLGPELCAAVLGLDSISADLDSFTLVGGAGDFAAPLGADPAGVVPLGGDSAVLEFAGFDLVEVEAVGSLTLPPAGPGVFPGLGGASTVASVSGATIDGGFLPELQILEWQASGESLTMNLVLPETPGATVETDLSPVLHWLGTNADVRLGIDLKSPLDDVFGEPSDITVLSGNLGPVFQSAGADTMIGDAVTDAIGFDPGVAARVGDGFIPVALTEPPLATIPPVPGLGTVSFSIVLDADGDGLLDGEEIAIGTNPDDPDTDDDLLTDGQEVEFGTDPLDPDSDDDGLLDGEDVEFLQNAINALPDSAFKGRGNRIAMLAILDAANKRAATGDIDQALKELGHLRERVDGCGAAPDSNDWIVDCTDQITIRDLLDFLITNLSS